MGFQLGAWGGRLITTMRENSAGWNTTSNLNPYPGNAGVVGFNPQAPYINRLMQDPNFVQAVSDRWAQLRSGIFSTSQLMSDMDANVAILANGTTNYPVGTTLPAGITTPSNPLLRNFPRWPELGQPVTTDAMGDPNGSWIVDVNLAKSWLTARVNWMDSQFIPPPTVTAGGTFTGPVGVTMSGNISETTTDTPLLSGSSMFRYTVPSGPISGWNLSGYNFTTGTWSTAPTGTLPAWGYDTTPTTNNFTPVVNISTSGTMDPSTGTKLSSLYVVTSFTLTQAQVNAIQAGTMALVLQNKYDDGYIAWINGDRVADANSAENTTSPAFSTQANAPQVSTNTGTLLNDQLCADAARLRRVFGRQTPGGGKQHAGDSGIELHGELRGLRGLPVGAANFGAHLQPSDRRHGVLHDRRLRSTDEHGRGLVVGDRVYGSYLGHRQ